MVDYREKCQSRTIFNDERLLIYYIEVSGNRVVLPTHLKAGKDVHWELCVLPKAVI